MPMINIEKKLNPAQYAAATSLDGPTLVIAGAGSGKTRVIEYRVLHLVMSGVDPRSILLLTFTKRASREMLGRAAKHDPRCANVDGGTFHSFCYRLLKRYAKSLGFSNTFSVMDEGDSREAIHRCAAKLGFYDREKRFPKKGTLRNILSTIINKNTQIEDILKKQYPHFLRYARDIDALHRKFAEYKITKNFMDYDDLLIYTRLLLEDPAVRKKVVERYRYIMVDEYQDTNAIQGDITYLLAKEHKNIMVVGDDAQSIYGFRGASHENIMKFPKIFPESRIMKLEENYRSTQSILDVGNSVLENMRNKYSKCLVSANKVPGRKPHIIFFKDIYQEAEWIAESIKDFNDQGVDLGHQAVLFRNLYVSIPLQAELQKRSIPYSVFGGLKFYETAHVKDVMAHLKVITNLKDELSWARILMLLEGIGPKKAEMISEEAIGRTSIGEIADVVFEKYRKKLKGSQRLAKLGKVLKRASRPNMGVGDKYSCVLEYYNTILPERFDDWHLRVNDLETLQQICDRYKTLDELLADFAIEPPERGISRIDPVTAPDERPLTISTIHSSKGLEWECVFLMGVMDGILPSKFSLDDDEEIEEEQRLFYVAITRAKRHLFLSVHHEGQRGGIAQFNRVSRFVDIPNVMSKLEQEGLGGYQEDVPEYIEDEEMPIYNKKLLLKKILDSYH